MYDYRSEFEKKYVTFTSDEFRDVIDDEDEANALAKKVGGVVKLCYFDDNYYPSTTSGEFLGFVVSVNGFNIVDEDEYKELEEFLNG